MGTPEVYPDVLGDALSYSSQRLAQLGSLVTAGATVEARRRARAHAGRAAHDERARSALRDQERAAWQLARTGWAPAHDSRWLAQADLLQTARVWSAAVAWADADPSAGSAVRKCEERLRALHPYAMAWYDRLRSQGAGAFDAMRQAIPLFGRAPHARPGDPAAHRRALESDTATRDDADDSIPQPGAGHGPDCEIEQRGLQIAGRLQARALAERGYALNPDELATTLGATTTLPDDVIARIVYTGSGNVVAEGAGRVRVYDADRVVSSPPGDVMRSEQQAAPGTDELVADPVSAYAPGNRTVAQLVAESFPCTAADAVRAAAIDNRSPIGTVAVQNRRRPGRSI